MPDKEDLNAYVEAYAGLEGRELIATVLRDFPSKTALLSSFGAESAVLLHMISEVDPDVAIVFLDTEKLFPETIAYRDRLVHEFGLTNVIVARPDPAQLMALDPDGNLHRTDTNLCCSVRKTFPMASAMHGYDVMISGRKRFHGALRSNLDFVSVQDDVLKVEPLAGHTSLDLKSYAHKYHLPTHPLSLMGYRSIGCIPCTQAGGTDADPRAGRWTGSGKTECGIHFSANGQILRTVTRESVVTA